MEEYSSRLYLKLRLLSLLAMIMVVYIHAYTFELNGYSGAFTATKTYNTFIQDFLSQGIARVASPFFFIISGYFFFNDFNLEWQCIVLKYKKRFWSLLIPFILWSALGMGLYSVLQLPSFSHTFFENRIISHFTPEQFLLTLLVDPIPYQLWFLRDLMLLVILAPAIWCLIKNLRLIALLVMLVTWALDLDLFFFTPGSVLFFSVGCFLSMHPSIVNKIASYTLYLPFLLAWFGLLIFKTELNYLSMGNDFTLLVLHKLAILVGIVAVWLTINALVEKSKVNSYSWLDAAVSPFFIYVFHEPLLTILKKGMFYLLHSKSDIATFLIYLITPLLAIVLCVLTARFLREYAPGLFGLLTGNRNRTTINPTITHSLPIVKSGAKVS